MRLSSLSSYTTLERGGVKHRKQLRCLLHIEWPHKISNQRLYSRCGGAEALGKTIMRQRRKLFGHILRLHPEAPAQLAMVMYCSQTGGKRGRPKTTLPVLLLGEAKQLLKGKQLSLDNLRKLAADRKGWQQFTEKILSHAYKSTENIAGASNKARKSKWLNKIKLDH